MKKIYVNLPVINLEKSTAFYEALGFTKNPDFSNNDASCMVWSDNILFMLLKHDFYQKFLQGKTIAHTQINSGVLLALEMSSREDVDKFASIAKDNGGSFFEAEPNKGLDFMYGLEVSDPDGNTMEPFFMDLSKVPTS
ncbi:MAG: VOC family protein [Candidatus Paceibacterota bacterium]